MITIIFRVTGLTLSNQSRSSVSKLPGRKLIIPQSSADPAVLYSSHNRGNIQVAIANNGTFGTFGETIIDPFSGDLISSTVYPKNSDILYLYVAAFWIGAIVDRDTLVSCGSEDFYETAEFWPEVEPLGNFRRLSIDRSSPFFDVDALSEEDFITEYTDTFTSQQLAGRDMTDNRSHIPLNIKINQRTMAWSYEYADDFILFDYKITNIGTKRLSKVYIGLWIDGDVWHVSRRGPEGWDDDIVGFLPTQPAPEGCGFIDTVNIAWTADNDGDPVGGEWDYRSPLGTVGARVIRTPSDSLKFSFNWWITNYTDVNLDFGPRRSGTELNPFRRLGSRLGTPEGDRNKYYLMSQQEFDYDLLFTAVNKQLDGWLPPPADASNIANGFDTRYLLSFGPFDIDPGQELPLSIAFVGGEDLHRNPDDFASFNPQQPQEYYNTLDFSNLALNARWASWVYDNPGYDTDGDGYRGKFRVCNLVDTFWYEGDGVPDFKGAAPPPAPLLKVIPGNGRLVARWNGYYSETTKDAFLGEIDFEGYRVYSALDDRPGSFSLLTSYDREDYNRFVWRQLSGGNGQWKLEEIPFTLDSLRILYNDSTFNPLMFTRSNPLSSGDELYYFASQDFNQSSLDSRHGIRKVYPEAPFPGNNPALWSEADVTYEHEERLPKYYEYEYAHVSLLPTIPYYLTVTAFDFGSPVAGLPSLETSPINNAIFEYPQFSADTVEAANLEAYVYPNPYRLDAAYFDRGFENRDGSLSPDRARRIHFSNLPRVCKISIYSLDGDLVKEIDHNFTQGSPQSGHETWDLITRNFQLVVSGIYYYVIQEPDRTQIGKIIILE